MLFDTYNVYSWFEVDVYKTKKSNYFFHGYIKDSLDHEQFIERTSEREVKETMKELNVDKYIELFGKVEEA